ncbi:hypothetical protein ACLB1E_36920 [Escherichia coli]
MNISTRQSRRTGQQQELSRIKAYLSRTAAGAAPTSFNMSRSSVTRFSSSGAGDLGLSI